MIEKSKIEKLKKNLTQLKEYFCNKKEWTQNEVIDFVSDCVSIFEYIQLGKEHIGHFVSFMYTGDPNSDIGVLKMSVGTDKMQSYYNDLRHKYYFIDLAFEMAFKKIELLEEQRSIVPKYIYEIFENSKELDKIKAYLNLVENNFQGKESNELLSNSRVLLDEIFNLSKELKDKNLGNKISYLHANLGLLEKFGINKDFLVGLDNSRLLRNTKIHHPKKIIEPSIPFAISSSCAFLVVTLLEFTIAQGDLINEN